MAYSNTVISNIQARLAHYTASFSKLFYCVLSVSVLNVSPTVSRSLLIPRRGFPSNSNTFRLGSRLRDAGRLTEKDTVSMKIPETQVMTMY